MSDITTFPFDPRRTLWSAGFIMPSIAPLIWATSYLDAPSLWLALVPLITLFITAPIIDHMIGQDHRNVSIDVLLDLENDPYYRRLLYLVIIAYAVSVGFTVSLATSGYFTPMETAFFTIGMGFIHSPLVLVGHELGHAVRSKRDQWMARISLSLLAYGHFTNEHNTGHHVKVATPEDPASARFCESVYRFALREIPGVLLGSIAAEKARLSRRGHNWFSPRNTLLQSWLITALIAGSLWTFFGWLGLAVYLVHCAVVWFSITMANYTAHYGILRRMIDGKREKCRPEHSWNSNFFFSNILFFNLQRHSDHHTNAQKPFQTLADVGDTPELPSGYPGLYFLMLIPPLWFAVINPILLEFVDHDTSRLNTG